MESHTLDFNRQASGSGSNRFFVSVAPTVQLVVLSSGAHIGLFRSDWGRSQSVVTTPPKPHAWSCWPPPPRLCCNRDELPAAAPTN